MTAVPKFGGRDCELSTTGVDNEGRSVDSWTVTQAILDQMGPALEDFGARVWSRARPQYASYGSSTFFGSSAYSSDCLRNWTSSGQCYYSDMGHVEVCTASCLSPTRFAGQCLSTVLAAERARELAEQESVDGHTYSLSTSNADLLDPAISFGTHLSMQVTQSLWNDLMVDQRRPATLGFVASMMAAAIPFFGAGYLLPLKSGRTIYSLSARAHHLTRTRTLSTTEPFGRGLLNSRRESHTHDHQRLHMIGFDFDTFSSAHLFSLLQCALAAAEEGGFYRLNLVDPVRSLRIWSWRMDIARGRLPATARLVDGRELTLPAYVRELATELLKMVEAGLITPEIAPEANRWLPEIVELAAFAEEGSLVPCSRRLCWAAKLLWLTQLSGQDGVAMGDPTTRLADHDFTNTDQRRGTMWRLRDAGMVDTSISLDEAAGCLVEGPPESRDWGRGQIIDRFVDDIESVDWSYVTLSANQRMWSPRLRIDIPQLDSLNKADFAPVIDAASDAEMLHEMLASGYPASVHRTDPIEDLSGDLATIPKSAND